jgi:hypothetical protein
VVDREEDPGVACALDDAAQGGDLLRRRRIAAGMPEARDPDGAEAGVLELAERGPVVADPVVYGSNQ